MSTGLPYTNNLNTLTPADVHEVDMDRRADWAETDVNDPSYIANKPNIANAMAIPAIPAKGLSDKTYVLKVASDGTVSWVEAPAASTT